jgi:acetyl-CoA acyltransferase 1
MARNAMTKAGKGNFKDTAVELMLANVFKAVVEESKIDPKEIEDIAVGNCLQPGAGATTARMGQLLAGIPETTSISAINRQCSSGLQSVMSIVNAIRGGQIDVGIGAGVENMSQYDFSKAFHPPFLSKDIKTNVNAANCQIPMGITSENVAEQFGVTREQQDRFAASSQLKALNAKNDGRLNSEITPMDTVLVDKEGNETAGRADTDEGVRAGTTFEKLSKLKPYFKKDGTTTAGNSSQLTDGAAAVLLARRSTAIRLGLPIKGRVLGYSVMGVDPTIMGIGPAVAIPKALEKSGLKVSDVDVYEINEAFASQALYCVRELGIDEKKVNPRGGAIALGHPLGATGSRQIVTLFSELERQDKHFGVVSMCIGTGMGAAGVFERE